MGHEVCRTHRGGCKVLPPRVRTRDRIVYTAAREMTADNDPGGNLLLVGRRRRRRRCRPVPPGSARRRADRHTTRRLRGAAMQREIVKMRLKLIFIRYRVSAGRAAGRNVFVTAARGSEEFCTRGVPAGRVYRSPVLFFFFPCLSR